MMAISRLLKVNIKVQVEEFAYKIAKIARHMRKVAWRGRKMRRQLATSSANRTNSPARRAGSRRTKRLAHRRPR